MKTIKKYDEFVNESLTKNDIYPYMMKGVLEVMRDHRNDNEYVDVKKSDGEFVMTVSSIPEKTIKELNSEITMFILPDNYKPNVGVGIDSGSYKRGASVEKFQFLKTEKMVEMAKEFYRLVKDEPAFNDISAIYLVVKY